MASRKIEDLDPRVQDGARSIVRAWQDAGFDVLVTCTYRSNEEQDKLYAQGRTAPGFKVTKARAGESYHNFRLALDFVPMIHGKPSWDDPKPFEVLAAIAKMTDPRVTWGGGWSFKDLPHLQWPRMKDGDHGGMAASPTDQPAQA